MGIIHISAAQTARQQKFPRVFKHESPLSYLDALPMLAFSWDAAYESF